MCAALFYRKPMDVHAIHVLYNGDAYPICPRCLQHLDREYMSFCNSCGQNLCWARFDKCKAVRLLITASDNYYLSPNHH